MTLTGSKSAPKAYPSSYAPAPGHRFKVGDPVVVLRRFPPDTGALRLTSAASRA
jgi:hypothetical protein